VTTLAQHRAIHGRKAWEVTADRYDALADIARWGQVAGCTDEDVDALVRKGLVVADGARWALTDAGKRALAGHRRAA
jgi:hypothetical protein